MGSAPSSSKATPAHDAPEETYRRGNRNLIFDIDGVIATGTVKDVYSDEAGWNYLKATPIPGAKETLEQLKKLGFRIVLLTSRRSSDRQKTVEWLEKHEIPYDEVYFDKPRGIYMFDDKAHKFEEWDQVKKIMADFMKGVRGSNE